MRPVQNGIVTVNQLADWMTRLLASSFLIPSAEPEQMSKGLEAMYRLLTEQPDVASKPVETSPAAAAPKKRRTDGRRGE